MSNDYYYYKSIRRYTLLMGTVVSGICIERDGKFIEIPVRQSYGNAYSKLEYRNNDRRDNDDSKRYRAVYPAIGFRLVSMVYANDRQLNPNNIIYNSRIEDNYTTNTNLTPSPYDFRFQVDIKTKNTDDMYQILEQILPKFNPDHVVTIEDIPNTVLEVEQNIPIILEAVDGPFDSSFDDFSEGNERLLTFNIDFVIRGFLYKNVKAVPVVTNTVITTKAFEETEKTMFFDLDNDINTYENYVEKAVNIGLHDSVIRDE